MVDNIGNYYLMKKKKGRSCCGAEDLRFKIWDEEKKVMIHFCIVCNRDVFHETLGRE